MYRQQVSALRKKYAAEISVQRAEESAKKALDRAAVVSQRKERQRLKNLQSIENAKVDIATKAARAVEFQKELTETQVRREARNERYKKARMLAVAELEEESVHWMVNREEVDAQLSGLENIQKLWATPCLIGVAPEDATFWRYQSHTMPRQKSFMSPREHILEQLEQKLDFDSNLNEEVWTPERQEKTIRLLEKVKLRALVQNAGKAILLQKQNEYMKEKYLADAPQVTSQKKQSRDIIQPKKKIPPPSMQVLVDYEAQEREGVKLLMSDPEKFFVFEEGTTTATTLNSIDSVNADDGTSMEFNGNYGDDSHNALITPVYNDDNFKNITAVNEGKKQNKSAPRGRPISLLHEFGNGNAHMAYPLILGRDLQADKRTDREKKRAEKEDERLARIRAAEETDEDGLDFEHDSGDLAEEAEERDGNDWVEEMLMNRGLEEGVTRETLEATPMHERLFDEDVEWIMGKLQQKVDRANEKLMREEKEKIALGAEPLTDDERDLTKRATAVLEKLTEAQMTRLEALDMTSDKKSDADMMKGIEDCLGKGVLTENDIRTIIEIERKLQEDEALRKKIVKDNDMV